jgi:pectin methylesterase-like acyl-CoA thioesterase
MFVGHRANGDSTNPSAALTAAGFFPAAGAKEICPDTPIRLTFSASPIVGAGKVSICDAGDGSVVQSVDVSAKTATQSIGGVANFNYYPLDISGNDVTIHLPNGSLAYNKTYYVTIDAGAFKSEAGPYGGISGNAVWRFATKSAPPTAGATKFIVAADGSGDFCTLQGSLDFIPGGNTTRRTILLRKGIYPELIFVSKKHALTITGEDRQGTVIAYANNAVFNPSGVQAYHRGVFLAAGCNDLVISNLTIRNTTPRGGSQAEALILNGNTKSRAIVANVDLYSFQDTLQINGQAYVSNCYIEGDVDFMWGQGPCFFENCHCYGTRSKAYYAQIRNPADRHGYVYHHCIFDGPAGVTNMYINRIAPTVFPNSEMVLLDCVLGPAVSPTGWLLTAAKRGTTVPTTAPNVHFWEFNSHDAQGKAIDVSKRLNVSRQLTLPQDAELINDYSKPSFVLGDNWDAPSDPNLSQGAATK